MSFIFGRCHWLHEERNKEKLGEGVSNCKQVFSLGLQSQQTEVAVLCFSSLLFSWGFFDSVSLAQSSGPFRMNAPSHCLLCPEVKDPFSARLLLSGMFFCPVQKESGRG